MRFSLFWMQKTLRSGDRRGSGREIPRAGNPRPSCLQRFCKRNRGAGLYARVRGGWTLLICPNYNGSGGVRQVGNAFFPKKESARRGAARRVAVRSGDSAPPSCAASADPRPAGGCRGRLLLRERGAGAFMRLHDGFMMDPTPDRRPGSRSFPFRMQNSQGSAGRRSPGREIPRAPRTRLPRLPKLRGRSGRAADRRSSGPNGRQGRRLRSSGCVRDRPRRPDAHAHAGHA